MEKQIVRNQSDAEEFVTILTGSLDSQLTFQIVDDGQQGILPDIVHGTLPQYYDYLGTFNSFGAGIHLMVNEGDGAGRKAANVSRIRAAFVDLDGSPLEPVTNAPLKPHIVVETSPGRYHCYYLIDGLAIQNFRPVQLHLATRFHGDRAVSDPSRAMRLPGFSHNKSTPFLVRLLAVNHHQHYPADTFLEAFEVNLEEKEKIPGNVNMSGGEFIPLHHRNIKLTSLGGSMRRVGMTQKAIEAALLQQNEEACEIPLTHGEVSGIARSVAKYDPAPNQFHLTDLGNAERLVYHHGENMRYCHKLGGWMAWDGRRWAQDDTGEVFRLAKETIRAIYTEAAGKKDDQDRISTSKHARNSEARTRIESMVKLAETEPGIPALTEEFDRHLYLLNCENGTLDLTTGELREQRREDLLTRITNVPYQPDSSCPQFMTFLNQIMAGNEDKIAFLQKSLGYSLTGDTSEQCWFLLHGKGNNGKSTLMNVIKHVLGHYAIQTPPATFLEHKGEGPRNDLAMLRGARFVCASEPDDRKHIDEQGLKLFTGQDEVTCRHLYRDYFSYTPEGKLFFAANHKPIVKSNDYGFWRRVRLIPFEVSIPEEELDKELPDNLKEEAVGILAWMVRGYFAWKAQGLTPPEEIQQATQEYQEESDVLTDFINEKCSLGDTLSTPSRNLYEAYTTYCGKEKPVSQNSFGRNLTGKGFKKQKFSNVWHWLGIKLVEDWGEGCRED